MNIDLKLGKISAEEFANSICAKLLFEATDAGKYEIEQITDKITEIKRNSLYIVSEDNSLAEMMAAAKNGAFAVLCTKAPDSLEKIANTAVIVCDNINFAIERFAKYYIKRSKCKTIAIVGATGKTRTGEFVYAVLEEKYKVNKATDKRNTEKDDAIAFFDITNETDFLIMELKFRDKKEAVRFSSLIECETGIVTELSEKFDMASNINALGSKCEKIICRYEDIIDDERLETVSVNDENASLHASHVRKYKNRTVFDIVGSGVLIKDVEIHFEGEENIRSALIAASVGLKYGITEEKIRFGLKNYHSTALSVEIYTVGNVTFIVDTTSATEESVKSGIDTLCDISKLHKSSRKIAFVGDIRDFGQNTRAIHENMGRYIVEKKIDKLFTFGVAAEQIGVGARRAGMNDTDISGNLEIFSPLKSAEALANVLKAGDILLVRTGRQTAAEEILKYLEEKLK